MHSIKRLRWILPVLFLTFLTASTPSQIAIRVTMAPPPLPVYEQPPCPEQGWMWVPGYWAWDDEGYYWVPGEWVAAPYTGALWTPPWWGWDNGRYLFHEGYWGNEVGYYGGIDYGHGYMGEGFSGGEWRDGRFAYNTAVMRVDPTIIHNTYTNERIVRERTIANDRHIAYSGGPNGIHHDPTPIERRGMTARHTLLTPVQQQQIQEARRDQSSYAKANGGRPQRVVVTRPEGTPRNGSGSASPAGRQPEQQITHSPSRGGERPEPARTSPGHRNEPNRNEPKSRPESRSNPAERRPDRESGRAPGRRSESQPAPERRNETRPTQPTEKPRIEPRPNPPVERPRTESRPAPQMERPRTESHPAPVAPRESKPAPASRPEPQHELRPAPQPHAAVGAESRPAAQHEMGRGQAAHAEPRPAPERKSHPPTPHQEKPRSE